MRRLLLNRVLVGTALLPVLFGCLVLWSLGDRLDRIDEVPAAVVNLDRPVTTGSGKQQETVAAGRLLAAGLTAPEPDQDHTLDWRLTNADEAAAGLRDGDYYAVITIPRDFSRTVAGLSRHRPGAAHITVRSNDSASALVGVVGDQIGEAAAARLNQQITATFLEGLYAGTGALRTSLGEAEQGADRLADGAVRLGEGTAGLRDGAGTLSAGLRSLATGSRRLADGTARLEDGALQLAGGGDRVERGARELAQGAGRLAGGLDRLHRRIRPLPDRTRQLADGAGQLAEGVQGWSQVLRGWRQACGSDPVLAGSHARLCAATLQAVGADDGNARSMVAGAQRLSAGTQRLADTTPEVVTALGAATTGADRLAEGGSSLAAGAARIGPGASRLASGAANLGSGARELTSAAEKASGGASRLADGSQRVAGATARLGAGSRRLAEGLGQGVEDLPALRSGTRERLAAAVARPVVSDADRINPSPSAATSLVPGVLALALWLGAFVTYLVRRGLPTRALSSALPAARVALAGWLPALGIGLAQSVLLFAALGLFDVALDSPFAVALFLLVPAAVFAALNQAFVAALGHKRGWMASIAFAVLQAVSLGGLVPADTAPALIRSVGGALPVPLAAEGIADLALGGRVGSAVAAAFSLLVWGTAAFVVTAVAARRRQRLSLARVRRHVATGPV